MTELKRNVIHQHNCLQTPWPIPDASVDAIITSPPYWGLRDYQHPEQIGQEPTPDEFVAHMVAVFTEAWRVLKPTGTLWLNLGDSYAGSGGAGGDYSDGGLKAGQPKYAGTGKKMREARSRVGNKSTLAGGQATQLENAKSPGIMCSGDLKPKDLVGIPWMVAFALRSAGWYLRQDIIWSKPNPMPESVTDRCSKSHEYIFLLSKSRQYYFDHEAIKVEMVSYEVKRRLREQKNGMTGKRKIGSDGKTGQANQSENGVVRDREALYNLVAAGKANKKSVWEVTTKPYTGAHFATFPEDLITDCVLASTSHHGNCDKCGTPWERVVEKQQVFLSGSGRSGNHIEGKNGPGLQGGGTTGDIRKGPGNVTKTTGWKPTCECTGGGVLSSRWYWTASWAPAPRHWWPWLVAGTSWGWNSTRTTCSWPTPGSSTSSASSLILKLQA